MLYCGTVLFAFCLTSFSSSVSVQSCTVSSVKLLKYETVSCHQDVSTLLMAGWLASDCRCFSAICLSLAIMTETLQSSCVFVIVFCAGALGFVQVHSHRLPTFRREAIGLIATTGRSLSLHSIYLYPSSFCHIRALQFSSAC